MEVVDFLIYKWIWNFKMGRKHFLGRKLFDNANSILRALSCMVPNYVYHTFLTVSNNKNWCNPKSKEK